MINSAKKAKSRVAPDFATVINIAGILLVCALAAYFRWCKLNSFVRDDPGMWLFQTSRAASGEVPYRDFSWNYPPMAIYLFSFILRSSGVTFAVAQTAINVLSLAVVLLSYWLVRYLLPASLHLVTISLLVVVGATAQTKFALFSLLTYSPSLHLATMGLLLLLIGAIRYRRTHRMGGLNLILLIGGGFIALVSKQEAILAVVVMFVLLALWDSRVWLIAAISLILALAAYAVAAQIAGLDNLLAGMSGYGLALFACPWWPTGLGVFGALASLGQAAMLFALLAQIGGMKTGPRLWWYAIPGAVIYLAYYSYLHWEAITSAAPVVTRIVHVVPQLFWTSAVFLPVMWVSIVCWVYIGMRLLLRRGGDKDFFVVLTIPVVMSVRSLFGTTMFPYTEVSALCYPFFIVFGTYLLSRFLSAPNANTLIAGVALGYATLRCVGAYPTLISDKSYTRLATKAGDVWLYGDDGSAAIYRYVIANTSESDTVLDIPYGGGVNFASRRRSPAFTTEFNQLRMPKRYQLQDLAGVERNPPKVVIADEAPSFGTSYGLKAEMDCPCPALVWKPNKPSWDARIIFPVVTYINDNYRVIMKVNDRLLLAGKDQTQH